MAVKSVSSTARGLTYYWQEHVENIEKYRTGGYHPIHLGDEFSNGRYQVIHKLGWGSFSTVWLAKDRVRNRYVALKVIIANASEENSEVKIMRHLHQGNLSHPGRSFILSLLDDFRIDGPNGQHQCIVTEVVGNSLRLAKESIQHEIFPLIAARIIAPQLAQGMAYIHSCGILHGDLYSQNISFQFPNIDSWTTEQVHEHFGEPRTNAMFRLDDQPLGPEAPSYTVEPGYLGSRCEEGLMKKIKIIDFGEASFAKEPRRKLNTPILLQAPEALFDESIGLPADIWALGCTIFEIFGKTSLFVNTDCYFRPSKHDALFEMVDTLGMLPDRWWKEWEIGHHYYSSDGTRTPHASYLGKPRSLPERVSHMRLNLYGRTGEDNEPMNREDAIGLMKLLMSILEYEPSKRATAEEVVNSEWIQRLLRESGQG